MGIDNFHTWLRTKYVGSFQGCKTMNKFDYIYIDINHLLHNCMNGIKSEKEFCEKLYKSLDLILCNFIATKRVIIGIDGTAPYSKVILQRKRRLVGVTKMDVNKLSPLHLTPGTEFMTKVNGYIKNYIEKMEKMYKYIKPKFEFISTDVPDEGEIKIFKRLKENGQKDNFTTHLVIGNDADLVVLATAMKNVNNIYIIIRYNGSNELLSIDKLITKFCGKVPSLIISQNDWRSDFTIVSLMMGNDYLPKLNFITYESVWKSYFSTIKECGKPLINDNIFDKDVVKTFFSTLVSNVSLQFQKLNEGAYNEDSVVNYLQGLLWCLNMYQTGKCSMYDYVYKYKTSPAPADINHYLKTNDGDKVEIPRSNTKPIATDVFTLLVMPKKAKKLVPIKYQKYMDTSLKTMYEREECVTCLELRGKLSVLHKKMYEYRKKQENENVNDDDDYNGEEDPLADIKKSIGSTSSELSIHKKSHSAEFSVTDIQRILKITNSISRNEISSS